jgi:hypothetical protein
VGGGRLIRFVVIGTVVAFVLIGGLVVLDAVR